MASQNIKDTIHRDFISRKPIYANRALSFKSII